MSQDPCSYWCFHNFLTDIEHCSWHSVQAYCTCSHNHVYYCYSDSVRPASTECILRIVASVQNLAVRTCIRLLTTVLISPNALEISIHIAGIVVHTVMTGTTQIIVII